MANPYFTEGFDYEENLLLALSSAEAWHFGPSIRAASMAQSAMRDRALSAFSLFLSAEVKQLNASAEESVLLVSRKDFWHPIELLYVTEMD